MMQETEKDRLFTEATSHYRRRKDSDRVVALLREIQEIYGSIPNRCLSAIAETLLVK